MRHGALLAFSLVLTSVAGSTPGQTQDRDETNTQVSLGYEYQHSIKEQVRAFGDLQYEELLDPHSLFGARNQLSTTGGVSYDASKRVRIEGGLGLYYTNLPDVTDTFEVRLWQAATLDWPDSLGVLRRYVLSHRFKLEERFKNTTDWDFAFRFRYRLAFAIPVNREVRYAWQRSRDTNGADFQTNDQFIEFRIKTQVQIRDLLKSR